MLAFIRFPRFEGSMKKRPIHSETDDLDDTGPTHRIPIIDKMMRILEAIEADGTGKLGIAEIAARTKVPRSTVYRVLNTLTNSGILARTSGGGYALGFRLVSLAAGVKTELSESELVDAITPHLEKLAHTTCETCKFSILKEGQAYVAAVVQSRKAMAPSSRVGSSFDLHAGAASKVLLAFAPEAIRTQVLDGTLARHTEHTIVERQKLHDELSAIRKSGISYDQGEWSSNVHAIAAPVFSYAGEVTGAISITYFASDQNPDSRKMLIDNLLNCTQAASLALGRPL